MEKGTKPALGSQLDQRSFLAQCTLGSLESDQETTRNGNGPRRPHSPHRQDAHTIPCLRQKQSTRQYLQREKWGIHAHQIDLLRRVLKLVHRQRIKEFLQNHETCALRHVAEILMPLDSWTIRDLHLVRGRFLVVN